MSALLVGGPAAANELELSRGDLLRADAVHQIADVGALVAGREGIAVRLSAVAELAQPSREARFVHVESADGSFTANVELATALQSGLILYAVGDGELPGRFGGPFRLLFADSDDCSVNVKDLGRIEFLAEPGTHTARCAD